LQQSKKKAVALGEPLTYQPIIFEKRNPAIVKARKLGVGLLMAFFALGMVISEFQRLVTRPLSPLLFAYLSLFLLTAGLAYIWIWSTEMEVDQLFHWLDPQGYTVPSTLKETAMILSIAVLLIGLLFASRDPLFYGLVFTSYSTVVPFTNRYVNRELAVAFQRSRSRIQRDVETIGKTDRSTLFSQAIDILDFYYLQRPHTRRHIIILIFSAFATAISALSRALGSTNLALLSYAILFLTIVGSEIVIGRWRLVRDQALRPIDSALGEIDHGA
jgi:hypothetical protein